MPAIVQTLLVFIVVLSLLVFAHELGHFVMAKRAGIQVQEFGFGYPPRLFSVRIGETIYSVNALPLGGFVRMLGENGSPAEPSSFASKSKRVRATVLVAGSAMNLLLAPLLFGAGFMVGEPLPCDQCKRVEVYSVLPGSPAEQSGLRDGDIFTSIDGQPIASTDDVRGVVQRAGERAVPVVVRRGDRDETLTLTPRPMPDGHLSIGISLGPQWITVHHPIWEAIPLGFQRTGQMATALVAGLGEILMRHSAADLAGPVGIAQQTGRAAQAGWEYLLPFTAFLSLNLAIVNLLPVPGLDGARLAFVILEGVRGRRVNPQVEGVIHFVGLMLLITLMVYVSYNDVRRLIPT